MTKLFSVGFEVSVYVYHLGNSRRSSWLKCSTMCNSKEVKGNLFVQIKPVVILLLLSPRHSLIFSWHQRINSDSLLKWNKLLHCLSEKPLNRHICRKYASFDMLHFALVVKKKIPQN